MWAILAVALDGTNTIIGPYGSEDTAVARFFGLVQDGGIDIANSSVHKMTGDVQYFGKPVGNTKRRN